jgi:hypothetical protein
VFFFILEANFLKHGFVVDFGSSLVADVDAWLLLLMLLLRPLFVDDDVIVTVVGRWLGYPIVLLVVGYC